MKSFLKSSVSALVFLSVATALNPSQAGNSGNGGEEKPEKKLTRSQKKSKKTESSSLNFEKHANKTLENLSVLYNGFAQNKEALQLMLMARGIDPEITKNTALVCKEWHDLVKKGKNDFRNTLLSSKADIQILRNTLLHPSAFMVAAEILAPSFPYQGIYLKFFKKFHDAELQQFNLIAKEQDIPENIKGFLSLIKDYLKDCPNRSHLLAENFCDLDPLNFKTVGLIAHVIKEVPSFQTPFDKILKKTSFELDNFPELIQAVRTHESLKKHLMALKLLTLSDDPLAKERMDEFEGILFNHLDELVQGSYVPEPNILTNLIKKNPNWLNHPLWSTYAVNTGDKSVLGPQLSIFSALSKNKTGKSLNFEKMERFSEYVLSLSTHLNDFTINLHQNINNIKFLLGEEKSVSLQAAAIDKTYEIANKENLPELSSIAQDYFEIEQYARAMEILQESYKKVGDFPYRFSILMQMADIILTSNKEDNFHLAASYLEIIKEEFNRTGTQELTLSYGQKEKDSDKITEITTGELDIYDLYLLECALHIFRGEFKEAYSLIKEKKLNHEMDLDCSPALMKALHVKHASMPQKLRDIFKKELMRVYSPTYLHWQKFIIENQEVYASLLEGHPLDKRAFKKNVKSIQYSYQAEKPSFEGKGKNPKDDAVSSEEDLSVSKKKNKKDKKDKR